MRAADIREAKELMEIINFVGELTESTTRLVDASNAQYLKGAALEQIAAMYNSKKREEDSSDKQQQQLS
jgi:hypothetical protein